MDKRGDDLMIRIDIPGRDTLEIENIVFDYNGTLAVNGKINQNIKEKLLKIKEIVNIYILTADTYGTVEKECADLGLQIKTFPSQNAGIWKKNIVKELGGDKTLCMGNGFNDIKMFEESTVSIGVIEEEGCCGKLLASSDIVVKSIEDGLNLILNTDRIKATLRS